MCAAVGLVVAAHHRVHEYAFCQLQADWWVLFPNTWPTSMVLYKYLYLYLYILDFLTEIKKVKIKVKVVLLDTLFYLNV